jgi:hypothetical protein
MEIHITELAPHLSKDAPVTPVARLMNVVFSLESVFALLHSSLILLMTENAKVLVKELLVGCQRNVFLMMCQSVSARLDLKEIRTLAVLISTNAANLQIHVGVIPLASIQLEDMNAERIKQLVEPLPIVLLN